MQSDSRPTDQRDAFEAWFWKHRFSHRYPLQKERDGTYQWHQVQLAWESWQAASSPEPAEQYPGLLEAARCWIAAAPHGDDCFVSDHYEGDPGNGCNCGKEALLSAIEESSPETKREGA